MINTNSNTNMTNPWFEKIQYIKRQNKVPILPTPNSGQIQESRKCGTKFLPGHLNVCPAKNEVCRICKKIGHFAKVCRSEMPPRPQYNTQQRRQQNYPSQQKQRNNQLVTKQTPQRMRNINGEITEETQNTTKEIKHIKAD